MMIHFYSESQIYFDVHYNSSETCGLKFIGDSEMCLGNINSGTLNDDIRKIFASADINTKKECRECWAKYFCSVGCNACNYHSCGDVKFTHKMSCLLMKKRIECAIVLKVFRAERQGKI